MAAKKAVKAKRKKAKRVPYTLEVAPDVQAEIEDLVATLEFKHIDPHRIVCFRSRGSTARIYARIWSLPRIWQMALGVEAHYAIEVVELYDRSSREDQTKTLIHELLHVPKTFSGALVPHKCFGKEINDEACDILYADYVRKVAARTLSATPREDVESPAAASRIPVEAVDATDPFDDADVAEPQDEGVHVALEGQARLDAWLRA